MKNSDLRQRAESLMRLMDQRDELSEDIKAAFDAAKSVGYSPAVLRQAVRVIRMDAAKRAKYDGEQLELETYLAEIEGKEALREVA